MQKITLSQNNRKSQEEANCFFNRDYVTGNITPVYLVIKRLTDILVSLVAGVVLLFPMLIIGIMVKLDSDGSALFSQERLGKHGKPFTIYKFRSMRTDAEANGAQWADKEDSRCTKLGRKLRDYRLDELPQLWNIFKGDMSLVGPRPERDCFYIKFEEYIPDFYLRMSVQPGLTGYAQVNGGYDLTPEEKIIFDRYYIEHQSLWMDIKCILRTVSIVFTHDGAR